MLVADICAGPAGRHGVQELLNAPEQDEDSTPGRDTSLPDPAGWDADGVQDDLSDGTPGGPGRSRTLAAVLPHGPPNHIATAIPTDHSGRRSARNRQRFALSREPR